MITIECEIKMKEKFFMDVANTTITEEELESLCQGFGSPKEVVLENFSPQQNVDTVRLQSMIKNE